MEFVHFTSSSFCWIYQSLREFGVHIFLLERMLLCDVYRPIMFQDVTKKDLHQQTLARLDWELEQRKR